MMSTILSQPTLNVLSSRKLKWSEYGTRFESTKLHGCTNRMEMFV